MVKKSNDKVEKKPDQERTKKKLSEVEAAGKFVLTITKNVQKQWSIICNELLHDEIIHNNQQVDFDFTLAIIATQIQALPNLLPEDQAIRIRKYVIQCLSAPELGSYPRDTILRYEFAWDKSLIEGEPPIYGIASVLFDKLGCQSVVEIGNGRFKSPLLIMALSEKIVKLGGSWWKNAIQHYQIEPLDKQKKMPLHKVPVNGKPGSGKK